MKKLFLLTLLILISCSSEHWNNETPNTVPTDTLKVDTVSADVSEEVSQNFLPENRSLKVKIPNEKCMNMEHFKVFQVSKDRYALAYHCKEADDDYCLHTMVLLAPQKGVDYYDDMRVNLPAGRCAEQDGVYQYETKGGFVRTVPVIRWRYKYEAENEEEYLGRLKEVADEAIDECKQAHIVDKTDTLGNMKKCESDVKEQFENGFLESCKKRLVSDKADTLENVKKCECVAKVGIDVLLNGKIPSTSEIKKKCGYIRKEKKKGNRASGVH